MNAFIRFLALALGLAGWLTYLTLWFGVRLFGSVTLTFGIWGPEWVEWFELWIEPAVLFSWLALIVWALRHELRAATRDAEKP